MLLPWFWEDIANVPKGKQPDMPMMQLIRERQKMQNVENTSIFEEGGKLLVISNRMQKGNSDIDLPLFRRGR